MSADYPTLPRERDRWILAQREGISRHPINPFRPSGFFLEEERAEAGEAVQIATIFLNNRECPWRCLMCDLWRHTLQESVPIGAIPAQIDYALAQLGEAQQVKLYNAGSFFDPRAILPADYPAIAERVRGFERVIIESHPLLIGSRTRQFRALVGDRLEVAMGLETVHPEIGPKLNKRVTLEQFSCAADRLREDGIGLRVFVLAALPFLDNSDALYWTARSVEFAFDCGADVVAIIPTRAGNGALDRLMARGEFTPPTLPMLETMLAHGVQLGRGRVFADLWDLERFSDCRHCFDARAGRLRTMNFHQTVPPPICCPACMAS